MAAEYIVHNNDFSAYDTNADLHLDRVDHNGTHYYTSCKCPKCGGSGYINYYTHVDGGVCFLCGGSGRYEHSVTVRTAEYQDKLNAKRLEKARKGASARNLAFFKREGFSDQGVAYIVLGDTYAIREDLKAAGAKYSNMLGWHFASKPESFPTFEISKDTEIEEGLTLLVETYDGSLAWPMYSCVLDYIKAAQDAYRAAQTPQTEHFGVIGEKIDRECSFVHEASYETQYGLTYIYTFSDAEGHQFVWKTSTWLDIKEGAVVKLKGTIKEHNEYRGCKQTMLTRCKVAACAA